jgi:hypothetical protein
MTCRISRFQDGGSLNNYITTFLAEGIFQTSVYRLGEFHKNRNKGNNKITELRTILQRESQNS